MSEEIKDSDFVALLLKSVRPNALIGDYASVKAELLSKLEEKWILWRCGKWRFRKSPRNPLIVDNLHFIKSCGLGLPSNKEEIWEFMSKWIDDDLRDEEDWETQYEVGLIDTLRGLYLEIQQTPSPG